MNDLHQWLLTYRLSKIILGHCIWRKGIEMVCSHGQQEKAVPYRHDQRVSQTS